MALPHAACRLPLCPPKVDRNSGPRCIGGNVVSGLAELLMLVHTLSALAVGVYRSEGLV